MSEKSIKTLIQKLISAFESKNLRQLKKYHTGFNNTTVKASLKHLYDTYGKITEFDLDNNFENMRTPWNQEEPLENVFPQAQKACFYE